MKLLFALIAVFFLSACVSPLESMSPAQVSQLSDDQICGFYTSYPFEEKTTLEVGKRRLNCNPNVRACMASGHKEGSAEMALCVNNRLEKARLQKQIEEQNRTIQDQKNQIIIQESINRNQPTVHHRNGQIIYCPGFPFCR
jgi:hypothetical protein